MSQGIIGRATMYVAGEENIDRRRQARRIIHLSEEMTWILMRWREARQMRVAPTEHRDETAIPMVGSVLP